MVTGYVGAFGVADGYDARPCAARVERAGADC